MGWNRDRSIERIKRADKNISEITVTPLTREMNLENVTLTKPKSVTGVHLYSAVVNEAGHITDALDVADQDAARSPLRAVHLWQREISRVVCTDFGAAKIHFQGTRLHALVYRPVSDEQEIAMCAIALAHAVRLTTETLNDVLGDEAGFSLAAGAAFGETLATRSGPRGDSELLFLGDAANQGAKCIKSGLALQVTKDLVDLLDKDVEGLAVIDLGGERFRVTMTQTAVEAVVERYKLDWTLDQSRKRIEEDLANTPLDKVGVSKATTAIDKDKLSLANSKLNAAVSLFGDIDGFTAIVEDATTNDAKARLIRRFHLMRSELRHVCTSDFDTLRVQYQGDRIQSLRHLPHGTPEDRALEAVKLAAAWQSTMEDTLPAVLGVLDAAHLAIGLDVGATAVSRLGERGNRDMICLGKPVRRAAKIEGKLDGNEIGLSDALLKLLPDRVGELFDWDAGKNCHVAKGLTYNDVVDAVEADRLDNSAAVARTRVPALAGADAYTPRPRWHR
jgi:class 3 adenylate cyclase